ncbi:hypothetical protein, partial [Methylobacterium sp. BTF04]|uniref:hypothetical protein n=1 Tax=Methylobacterium sp. BTF04 TaxID=2708300 RepID=UPI001954763B
FTLCPLVRSRRAVSFVLAMYEAVIGLVFLTLALGSYLSFTVKPKETDDGEDGKDTGTTST